MNVLLRHLGFEITALVIFLTILLLRWIAKVAEDELAGMGKALSPMIQALKDLLTVVGSSLWGAWCWGYTLRWKFKSWSMHKASNSLIGVLLVASMYVVVEVSVAIVRFLADTDRVDQNGKAIPRFWVIPHFHAPLWVEMVLLVLALFMVLHHWNEWRHRTQNLDMPPVVADLLLTLDGLRTPGTNSCTLEARLTYLEKVLSKMKERFEEDDKRKVWFSLMEESEGNLAVTFIHPDDGKPHGGLRLKKDEGGAGAAFSTKSAVYIPSTKHRIGINVDTRKTMGFVYRPDPTSTEIRCLLCVPIFFRGKVFAVLNIGCDKRSAFNPFQLDVGKLTSALITTVGKTTAALLTAAD